MSVASFLFSSHQRLLPKSIITPAEVSSLFVSGGRTVIVAGDFNRWERWLSTQGSNGDFHWFEPFSMSFHQIKDRIRHMAHVTCLQGVPSLSDAASYVNFLGGQVPTAPVVKQLNGYTDSLNVLVSGVPVKQQLPDMSKPSMVVIDGGFRVESVLPAFDHPVPRLVFQMTQIGGEDAIAHTNACLQQHGYRISPVHQQLQVDKITTTLVKKYPVWQGLLR